MHCPFCRHPDSRVVDSRTADDGGSIRRRRQCPNCQRRFSTLETSSLQVVKRSGVVEPFSRDKVVGGLRKASQGRPVSDDDLARLAQQVEETIRASGSSQVEAHDVGTAILDPLRALDEVAYLRYASVYSAYDSLEDFESAIAALRADRARRVSEAEAGQDEDAAAEGGPARAGVDPEDVSGEGAGAVGDDSDGAGTVRASDA